MTHRQPSDSHVRAQALDPAQSFLIQAPAGSGKTELLTDRILALLATVGQPEEIVAITFTRKAASEMHARVMSKLQAGMGPAPQEAHRMRSWELARAALARDEQQGWQLLQHPVRLSIRTIDAYCAHLVRSMPWLSALGGMPSVTDDARGHYEAAARATLELIDEFPEVAELVAHLDVDMRIAESLIADMLGSRDQWMPLLGAGEDIDYLEHILQDAVEADLRSLAALMPRGWAVSLAGPVSTAAAVLSAQQASHALEPLLGWDGAPFAAAIEDLPRWQALAHVLLTSQNDLRKQVTKTLGFEAKSAHKEAFTEWLQSADPQAGWVVALARARQAPQGYDAVQRATLRALLKVLKLAAAQLKLCFGEAGEVDFIEIAQSATQALGSADDPGDLLLKLDARLRHILVDEFQDTSQSQIELLRLLTSGWMPGDGRTLFLVGDPMQSIYRFRKAEVGWFLRVQSQGLGELPLTALQLTTNFRSQANVVDWVNRVFQHIFPAASDPVLGAITYTPSEAFQPGEDGLGVALHPVWTMSGDEADPDAAADETERIMLKLAREALEQNREHAHPVAILVRARPHLEGIVRRLSEENIPCRAVELEPLRQRQLISDLVQLARALSHPGDRLAWLSVLRSPLCGLRLESLHAIAGGDLQAAVPVLLSAWLRRDAQGNGGMDEDEAQRARHACRVLLDRTNASGAVPFPAWLQDCWVRLGGREAYPSPGDAADTEQVFRLLETLAPYGNLDLAAFEQQLERLFAAPGNAERAVEVMTIHKSKGLEFETVILAGLHRRPRADTQPLIRFEQSDGDIMLGPITPRASETPDPVSAYLAQREKQRSAYETDRLLYVGATRARRQLHLVGEVALTASGGIRPPAAGSLLGRLWDHLPEIPHPPSPETLPPQEESRQAQRPAAAPLARLPLSLLPVAEEIPLPAAYGVPWQWQDGSGLERLAGTVAHGWLERIGRDGVSQWPPERLQESGGLLRTQLARTGLVADALEQGVELVMSSLLATVRSERGRWLLGLANAHREWSLLDISGRVSVIDLAIADESGWLVVDYKTGAPAEGESEARFAQRMRERYAGQLERYCEQVTALDGRPARGALYFPRVDLWLDQNSG
ncbi:UvrD-helicase domain-containing protein [Paracandidimonas soli]|uniref:DNA 3'-5' helicase n=1 Tax=Paracandidimonas soli TaxID=1917182 RepID=A0A4V2VRH3_9BURK|nr:UvrD-helicase domain-containing protein [Paracandidimonas soli]TCU98549.1 DNA helicase/exodeoxyribonuclease V subunit A [Paracandidimonas soli]